MWCSGDGASSAAATAAAVVAIYCVQQEWDKGL